MQPVYIHHTNATSPQQSFEQLLEKPIEYFNGQLLAIESNYEGIPLNVLRRMGKAVRLAVSTALPLLKNIPTPDGIIIATANGGMDDCIKFLNQIIEYDEGVLTPASFVQSTANAIAGQIGLITANKGYNCTHVHMGNAFENALMDAAMQLQQKKERSFLLGAVDDISSYNYNINFLEGLFKQTPVPNTSLFEESSAGSLAGEGAAMFAVSNVAKNAIATITGIRTLHTKDEQQIKKTTQDFIQQHSTAGKQIDLLLTGENGDSQLLKYYAQVESCITEPNAKARFKHCCGEYPTAISFALWLSCHILQQQKIPAHCLKKESASPLHIQQILIYNNYKGEQHGWMIVEC